ncbi:MAG: hypothetical protein ACSHX8_01230 [Opitutaceae bacterium]
MAIEQGEKLHVIIRRNFEEDHSRHFVGEAIEVVDGLARVEGYSFWRDTRTNVFARKADKRTRIVSLMDAGNIITVLPPETVIANVVYRVTEDCLLVVTDGKHVSLSMNELGS